MLAVNCRAYQAALILFDAIKRIANRECTSGTPTPGVIPSHTTVPFYDHLESTGASGSASSSQLYTEVGTQNTEEKLKNVMNAWFSKDTPPPSAAVATPAATSPPAGTAPVITPLHSHVSGQAAAAAPPATTATFAKRSGDVDWLYQYSQPPPTNYPVSQPQFDTSCRSSK